MLQTAAVSRTITSAVVSCRLHGDSHTEGHAFDPNQVESSRTLEIDATIFAEGNCCLAYNELVSALQASIHVVKKLSCATAISGKLSRSHNTSRLC